MNKRIGDMTRDELMDYIIELDEENGRYERQLKQLKKQKDDVVEYIKSLQLYGLRYGKTFYSEVFNGILRMLGEIDE